jgi:hypothetical protein
VVERLVASEEGLSSMVLVSYLVNQLVSFAFKELRLHAQVPAMTYTVARHKILDETG